MLFSALRPTEGGITSADAFRRITSQDVSPGITSCAADLTSVPFFASYRPLFLSLSSSLLFPLFQGRVLMPLPYPRPHTLDPVLGQRERGREASERGTALVPKNGVPIFREWQYRALDWT